MTGRAAERVDVLVVGAGPAGAMAALGAAQAGASVLLVDRAGFPRDKVCGCCLSPQAVAQLGAAGLDPEALGGRRLRVMRLSAGGRSATLPLNGQLAVSRRRLDALLAEEARRAGAAFRDRTAARLLTAERDHRAVELVRRGERWRAEAGVVIAADGLAGRLLADEPGMAPRVWRRGRIGLGATLPSAAGFEPGVVYMAIARDGYFGAVVLEDGRLDLAAAADPRWVQRCGSPADAVAALLKHAGWPAIPGLAEARWRGTPRLTRRRRVAAHRLLVAGDAAGYAEPFTGEGIGWALTAGAQAGRFAAEAARSWHPEHAAAWATRYHRLLAGRHRRCATIAAALRIPGLPRLAATLLAHRPTAVARVVAGIGRPAAPGVLTEAGARWA